MSFDSLRSLEIEFETANQLLQKYKRKWDENRTVENEYLMKEQQDYVGQIAYEIQKEKMHDILVRDGFHFDADEEDMVIEYASQWSENITDVAFEMEKGNLRRISFDEYVEEYVVSCYEGCCLEVFREFQRWLPTDDFKEFVRNHYTDGEEGIVENFDDDYIIIMNG